MTTEVPILWLVKAYIISILNCALRSMPQMLYLPSVNKNHIYFSPYVHLQKRYKQNITNSSSQQAVSTSYSKWTLPKTEVVWSDTKYWLCISQVNPSPIQWVCGRHLGKLREPPTSTEGNHDNPVNNNHPHTITLRTSVESLMWKKALLPKSMMFHDSEIILTQSKIYLRQIFILPYRKWFTIKKHSPDIMSEHR